MKNPRLLSVILNYRTPDMTLRAATALLAETKGLAASLIIVDNASGDGSYDRLVAGPDGQGWNAADNVTVIQSPINGGFGAGNNFGILAGLAQSPGPDLIYVLNSDAFPDKGAISALIDALKTNPTAGFAGSFIHGPDGTPHITAFRFPSISSELENAARFGPISRLLARTVIALPVPDKTRPVDWVAGASLMMRREVLQQIGLFDERFFLYFEETDLCLRAARAGWQTLYVRESAVTHIGSVSTGMKKWTRMPGYWFQSRQHYFVKNHGRAYAARATFMQVIGAIIQRLRAFVTRRTIAGPRWFLRDLICFSLCSGWRNRKAQVPQVNPTKEVAS